MSFSFFLWYALNWILSTALDAPPNYNVYNPPETAFSCEGKVVGGYYADPEALCQLFHICVQIDETQVQDFRFLCPNDTLFDQENFVCADWRDVNCSKAIHFYDKNLELFKPTEDEVDRAQHQYEIDHLNQDNTPSRRKRQMLEAPLSPNDTLAQTNFSCDNRMNGGYYADVEMDCQVFHLCKLNENGRWIHKKFKCLNGTAFDQKKLICRFPENPGNTSCAAASVFYNSSLSHQVAIVQQSMETNETVTSVTMWDLPENKTLVTCCANSNVSHYSDDDREEDDENFTYFNYSSSYLFETVNEFNITSEPSLQMFNLSTLSMIDDDGEDE